MYHILFIPSSVVQAAFTIWLITLIFEEKKAYPAVVSAIVNSSFPLLL